MGIPRISASLGRLWGELLVGSYFLYIECHVRQQTQKAAPHKTGKNAAKFKLPEKPRRDASYNLSYKAFETTATVPLLEWYTLPAPVDRIPKLFYFI